MALKKICFVIMGFGKKTDFSTGVTYNLDQTYKNIINPAVVASGYECIRADELKESGIIDKSMYALLMRADLVIADISTYNPNAIYELGVRHAVRPFTTIIIKEDSDSKIPFDLDHTRIFKYAHLGDDIGTDESKRCIEALTSLIASVEKSKAVDSPLYEYVKDIHPPQLPEEEYHQILKELAAREKHIFAHVEKALLHMEKSEFDEAYTEWQKASKLAPSEPYFIQQQALCRYKSKKPSANTALVDALGIINQLDPEGNTNDPETLGIAGAIYKNLWLLEGDSQYLYRAIHYYGKGFKIRNDYYNGENYALCLDMKAQLEKDPDEITYARMEAKKTRQAIVIKLESDIKEDDFYQRNDRKWVFATLSQCHFILDEEEKASAFEKLFLEWGVLDWEIETFYKTRGQLEEVGGRR